SPAHTNRDSFNALLPLPTPAPSPARTAKKLLPATQPPSPDHQSGNVPVASLTCQDKPRSRFPASAPLQKTDSPLSISGQHVDVGAKCRREGAECGGEMGKEIKSKGKAKAEAGSNIPGKGRSNVEAWNVDESEAEGGSMYESMVEVEGEEVEGEGEGDGTYEGEDEGADEDENENEDEGGEDEDMSEIESGSEGQQETERASETGSELSDDGRMRGPVYLDLAAKVDRYALSCRSLKIVILNGLKPGSVQNTQTFKGEYH
ncbi:hypothetical protein FRC06_007167, partial [Ceratobasidium sp. 370]